MKKTAISGNNNFTFIKKGILNQKSLFGIISVPVAWYFVLIMMAPIIKYAATATMTL